MKYIVLLVYGLLLIGCASNEHKVSYWKKEVTPRIHENDLRLVDDYRVSPPDSVYLKCPRIGSGMFMYQCENGVTFVINPISTTDNNEMSDISHLLSDDLGQDLKITAALETDPNSPLKVKKPLVKFSYSRLGSGKCDNAVLSIRYGEEFILHSRELDSAMVESAKYHSNEQKQVVINSLMLESKHGYADNDQNFSNTDSFLFKELMTKHIRTNGDISGIAGYKNRATYTSWENPVTLYLHNDDIRTLTLRWRGCKF